MIAILVGTRPELIKMASTMRALDEEKLPYLFIHSNQHYSEDMDARIIKDLKLRDADHNLHVGSGTHAVQTGKIMEGIEAICEKLKPSVLVVHGDTNTTLGGALTAKKLQVPVAHVEAGLRSFDYRMPEEINRILVDRISDILFAPTSTAKQNLLNEGIDNKTIVVTGNTIVDAVKEHAALAAGSHIMKKYRIKKDGFILITLHRAENVDNPESLISLLKLIQHASVHVQKPVFWPIHPRTQSRLTEFKLTVPKNFTLLPPVGYFDMLKLMQNAALIMTDSGGIQEEAYILRRPVVTLRDSTERPETLSANFIIYNDIKKFDQAWEAFCTNQVSWGNEFGEGTAAKKIVETLKEYV